MHAFSYSIKNIISFRRIVLPQRPRTRKTRVEEASPPPLLPPIQLLSASSVFLLLFLQHRHSLSPSLSLSLVSSRFSSSYNPVLLALLRTTRAPRSFPFLLLFRSLPPPSLLPSPSLDFSPFVSFSLTRPLPGEGGGIFSPLEFSPLLAKLGWYYPRRKFRDIPWREIYRKINYATSESSLPSRLDKRRIESIGWILYGESQTVTREIPHGVATCIRFESLIAFVSIFVYLSRWPVSVEHGDKTLPRHESFFSWARRAPVSISWKNKKGWRVV